MNITVLKSKIHKVEITDCNLNYEGSCEIDENILNIVGIQLYEQIHIYNVNNGKRFVTYAIRGEAGSGIISLNGAAARLGMVGDVIVICAYGEIHKSETIEPPLIVYFNNENEINKNKLKDACLGHLNWPTP
jgi:aspartate 1-decarboxylase